MQNYDDPPKHCCPYWDCDYIDVETLDGTVTYDCGAGPQPFFFNARCVKTVDDVDYREWKYQSEGLTGQTLNVTVKCDRTELARSEGRGPCATIEADYDGGVSLPGVAWCFGPITMARQCQCLTSLPPGFDHVGFTWGTTTMTAEQLAADPNNDCTCTLIMGTGTVLTVYCVCAGCPCVGFPSELEARYQCTTRGWDFVIPLSYVDKTTLPSPNDPYNFPPYPSKAWFGSYDLGGGCSLELVISCDFGINNAGPELNGLYLVIGPGCTITPEELSSDCGLPGPGFPGNIYVASSQCHTDSLPFELVYGFCSTVPVGNTCTGTLLSTLTIREV